MNVASALVSGNDPLPRLAEEALSLALGKTDAGQATGVLLFLTAEFSGHAQQTVTAVARAARCTEVAGGIAAGVFTERGWVLDRPAAALMVLTGSLSLDHRGSPAVAGERRREQDGEALLSYSGSSFPSGWGDPARARFGGSFAGSVGRSDPVAWQHARLAAQCSVRLPGAHVDVGVSSGWRLLGSPSPVTSSHAYELLRLGDQSAFDSLIKALPAGRREQTPLSLASLCAVLINEQGDAPSGGSAPDARLPFVDCSQQTIAIIAANADQSVTLAEPVRPGQRLAWAIRLPQSAAEDMRQSVARLASVAAAPVGAVAFSCIGRGPYFHDGEDCELDCLRERFPGLPLLGSYGTGQIAPSPAAGNRLLHNAVVTAIISSAVRRSDVQSQP